MFGNLLKMGTVLAAGSLLALVFGFAPSNADAAEPYNSAQLKYLFEDSEIDGAVGACDQGREQSTVALRLGSNLKASINYVCISSYSGSEFDINGSGTWAVENNKLCLTAPSDVQFWKELSGENCWQIVRSKWGFSALDSKGKEDWTMSVSHPKHSSREELYVALATISDVVEIAEQKAKAEAKKKAEEESIEARRQAEADKQARIKQQRSAKEKRRQQEMAEAAKRQEIYRKRKAVVVKKQKKAREIVKLKMAAISDTLKTCLSSSSIQADQLEAKITALNQQVSCYDTALKEVGAVKTPVKSVQADIKAQQKALSDKRRDVAQALAQTRQVADAAVKRREEAKRKKKELALRKKLAGSSALFKGDARDFVFFANLSSENVTLGLSGQPAFLKSPIPTCYVTPTKIDVDGDEFTADAVGLAKVKTKSNLSFKPCGDLDTETSDLIVFRRGIIGNANISTLNKLVSAQKDGVMSQFFVAEAVVFDGRKLAEKKAAGEAEKQKQATIARITEEVLSGEREGFGFVVADPSSSVVCIETGDTWPGAARIVTKKELGAPDHIAERPVTVKAASLEKTFINMKLKKCGTVFANAKSLAMIYKALKRDKINAEFAHVWVDGKTLKAEGKKAKNEAVADEKDRREAEAERKRLETAQKKEKAAQLLKKETERKQKIKRKKAKLARQKKKKKSIKQQILEKNQKAKELLGMHRDSTLTLITLCIPQARSAAVTLADMKISAPDMFVHAAPEFSSYCNNPLITGNLIAYAFKNWTAIKSRQKQRTWVAEAKNGKWAAIAEQCPYQCQ